MRVLLAVKDRSLRSILRSYLLGLGHEIEVVRSGLGCVSSMREDTPDVLIIQQGLHWGGSDGVMQWVQQELRHQSVAVIFLAQDKSESEQQFRSEAEESVTSALSLNDLLLIDDVLNKLKRSSTFCIDAIDYDNPGAL